MNNITSCFQLVQLGRNHFTVTFRRLNSLKWPEAFIVIGLRVLGWLVFLINLGKSIHQTISAAGGLSAHDLLCLVYLMDYWCLLFMVHSNLRVSMAFAQTTNVTLSFKFSFLLVEVASSSVEITE